MWLPFYLFIVSIDTSYLSLVIIKLENRPPRKKVDGTFERNTTTFPSTYSFQSGQCVLMTEYACSQHFLVQAGHIVSKRLSLALLNKC